MKAYIAGTLIGIALAGCQTTLQGATSAGEQTLAAVCNEGQAIQTAASSQAGVAAAAQAGINAGKVAAKVATLNTTLQGYCSLIQIALPLASDAAQQVMTASAGVLGTHAAPPALVAAAKQ